MGLMTFSIPSIESNLTEVTISMDQLILFIAFYTDIGGQIIVLTFSQIATAFALMSLIYEQKMNAYAVLIKILLVFGVFVVNSILATIPVYSS